MSTEDFDLEKAEKVFDDTAMIALIPTEEDAARLAVPDGQPADELHVTIRYLGFIDDLSGDDIANARNIAVNAARDWQEYMISKIAGDVAGFGVLGRDDPAAAVLFLNGWDLDYLYRIMDRELDIHGLDMGHYRPWIPHITLGYGIEPRRVEGPILFDRLRFALGSNNYDYYIIP